MKYELTQHAREILHERDISLEWLERILAAPERIEPDSRDASLEHRLGRIAQHGNRVLRVILNPQVTPPRVVTVYFDRTMRDKL